MKKVLLIGEPMALLTADRSGPLEEIEHFTRTMSGTEVNVAIGLSRLGFNVEYMTRLGDDPFGHYIFNKLENSNIGTRFISFDSVYRTGIQLKNKTDDGSDSYAPYYRKGSAASRITTEDIQKIDFSEIDLIHVTGIPPALSQSNREATFALMEKAKTAGITITFDPNLRPALWENEETMRQVINELAFQADIFLPGKEESSILCGTDNLEEIAAFYQKHGVKMVIIKDGANGAYANYEGNAYYLPAFKVDKVVDTVGAGDGFAVGVISGILLGKDMVQILKEANAIGALQVMNIGDNEGLPSRSELDKFISLHS